MPAIRISNFGALKTVYTAGLLKSSDDRLESLRSLVKIPYLSKAKLKINTKQSLERRVGEMRQLLSF
jgi:hypothetical protein